MQPLPFELPEPLVGLPTEVVVVSAAVVVLAIVLTFAVVRIRRRQRHAALEERFAGEYERTVISSGSRRRAEAELRRRIELRRTYTVNPLGPGDRATFRTRVKDLESGFVDGPETAAAAALDLIVEIATTRGYPDTEVERCLDDLSVDHPQFVADLRRELDSGGSTSATERHRRVVVRARVLIERLLSDGEAGDEPASWSLIREILDDRRFHVVFQPIHSLDDGRTYALEALTRFDDRPHRPPHVWFQQAAAVGLGADLELAAIRMALEDAASVPDDIAISVNVAPATINDERLQDVLDRYPHKTVILEVTEHAIVEDYESIMVSLQRLRSPRVRLAVDDTGAGVSSLRHIIELTPDVIKLDRSLTQDVLADPVRQALASSLVHFAHRIDAQLIAEKVETSSDLAGWQDLGAHAAQGNLLSPPSSLPAPTTCEKVIPRPRAFGATPTHDEPRHVEPRRAEVGGEAATERSVRHTP